MGLALLTSRTSHATLLVYEGFNYPVGSNIVGQNGGLGFSQPWQLNSSQGVFTNQAFSLSYTDAQSNRLVTTGGSLLVQGLTNGDFNAQPNRTLSYYRGTNFGVDGVTTWVSFLAVRQGPPTNSVTNIYNPYPRAANLSLYNGFSNTEKLAMGNTALTPSNNIALLPQGNINNIRTSGVNYSRTNFIVVRIDHVTNALDNAWLFVNPPLATEPPTNSADTNSIGQFDFSFNRIRPFAGGNRPSAESPYAELVLDEIRIGETFADVAPYIPPLLVSITGNNAILTWAGAAARLQTAAEVSGPYTNIPAATSPFTNNLSDPCRFFRLSN